jgi:hypothetical protein
MEDLDLLRAHVEGRLDAADGDRLRARLDADPALRELLAEYRAVHAATAAAPPPASGATFEGVLARAAPRRVWRIAIPLAAAAALVLALQTGEPQEPLVLRAVPLAPPAPAAQAAPPALLADYAPVADGRLRFLGDLPAAREVAAFTGLPLLLYVHVPGCPLCTHVERDVFGDARVRAAAAGFVLAEMDWFRARDGVLGGAGYEGPLLLVEKSDGARVEKLRALVPAGDLARDLGDARLEAGGGAVDWARLKGLAARLRDADRAAPGERLRAWREVAAADPEGPLGACASARADAMAADAHAALAYARGR